MNTKVVPVEPTEEMLKAGANWFEACLHSGAGFEHHANVVYEAMLAAAPVEETEDTFSDIGKPRPAAPSAGELVRRLRNFAGGPYIDSGLRQMLYDAATHIEQSRPTELSDAEIDRFYEWAKKQLPKRFAEFRLEKLCAQAKRGRGEA